MPSNVKEDAREGLFAHSLQRGEERHGLYPTDVVAICDSIAAHGNNHQKGVVLLRPDHRGESRLMYAVRTISGSWIPVVWDSSLKVTRTILPEDALFDYRPLLQRIDRAHFETGRHVKESPRLIEPEISAQLDGKPEEDRREANELANMLGASGPVQCLSFDELGRLADRLRDFNIECNEVIAKRRRGIPSDAMKGLRTSKLLKKMISAHRSKHSATDRIKVVCEGVDDPLAIVDAMFKSGCELLRMTREKSPEIHEEATQILRNALDAASSYVTLETARRSGVLE